MTRARKLKGCVCECVCVCNNEFTSDLRFQSNITRFIAFFSSTTFITFFLNSIKPSLIYLLIVSVSLYVLSLLMLPVSPPSRGCLHLTQVLMSQPAPPRLCHLTSFLFSSHSCSSPPNGFQIEIFQRLTNSIMNLWSSTMLFVMLLNSHF